jgi:hypothetical protein
MIVLAKVSSNLSDGPTDEFGKDKEGNGLG